MALSNIWSDTAPAMRETFGPRFRWTGQRCPDGRPIFEGSNTIQRCNCDDH